MTNHISRFFLICFAVATLAGCAKINTITDSITKPSAREVYKRDFGKDPRYAMWQLAFENAAFDSIKIDLPYTEKGNFRSVNDHAYNYLISLKEGESLIASVASDTLGKRVFFDLFELKNGARQLVESGKDANLFEFDANNTGVYKLVIQPEIDFSSNFTIIINKKPQYGFPVAGKGNSAIQSFMGMPRDNGARRHEGIDIFAAKGTPVVAVANGTITNTGDRGLGGKQVWQRAGLFGNALYYAHLDSIATSPGTRVKTGDTIGYVGSTGNAKGGPPHLHFGIYRAYGAVDPLPFVYRVKTVLNADYKPTFTKNRLTVSAAKASLRQSPDAKSGKFGELRKRDTVVLLGQHKNWLHVKTPSGKAAFLHKDLVRQI